MKSKLTLVLIFLALGMIFPGPKNANAASWALASINQVGKSSNESVVQLTHVSSKPVFKNKFFRFNSENSRDFLAVALTALSLGKNVVVLINDNGITIDSILIRND